MKIRGKMREGDMYIFNSTQLNLTNEWNKEDGKLVKIKKINGTILYIESLNPNRDTLVVWSIYDGYKYLIQLNRVMRIKNYPIRRIEYMKY